MAGTLSGYLGTASNLYGSTGSKGSGSAGSGGGYGGTDDSSSLASAATTISGQNTFAIGGINLGNQTAPQVNSGATSGLLAGVPTYAYYAVAAVAALFAVWKLARRR